MFSSDGEQNTADLSASRCNRWSFKKRFPYLWENQERFEHKSCHLQEWKDNNAWEKFRNASSSLVGCRTQCWSEYPISLQRIRGVGDVFVLRTQASGCSHQTSEQPAILYVTSLVRPIHTGDEFVFRPLNSGRMLIRLQCGKIPLYQFLRECLKILKSWKNIIVEVPRKDDKKQKSPVFCHKGEQIPGFQSRNLWDEPSKFYQCKFYFSSFDSRLPFLKEWQFYTHCKIKTKADYLQIAQMFLI